MINNIQLTLFIPNLLITTQGKQLKNLAKLLGKAKINSIPSISVEEKILELFGYSLQKPLSIAPLTALADGLTVNAEEWWIRCDPVELQADQKTVFLTLVDFFDLTENEVKELLIPLNQLLQSDNLTIIAPHPNRWYIKLKNNPEIETISPKELIKNSIKSYLKKGNQKTYWQCLFSELQMLLNQHPLNEYRLKQAKPLINGLWFWGEGYLPTPLTNIYWKEISTNSLLAKGLATLNHISFTTLPETFSSWFEKKMSGKYLLISDTFNHETLLNWEINWFQPLLIALKNKTITQLNIYTDQCHFSINCKDANKWWKMPYNFSHYQPINK
ncbi:MAG: hypothetical protein LEGION0398_MBIBDBAK_01092 [Legionellaceae bacterium]